LAGSSFAAARPPGCLSDVLLLSRLKIYKLGFSGILKLRFLKLTVGDVSFLGVIDFAKVVERAAARKAADQSEKDEQDARRHHHDARDHHNSERIN